ncbi:MAG TPA: dephospho-CoA kinase [Rhodocyclaceae bacterium]|nr:dephospho-CoA kinase [Rhodocyclaceae bacterium]HRQ47649.1 dephospho-CoA kinase [Rhodocyclaceae bacterium]
MQSVTRPGPFIVGLTGGIGSGKSAVADRFALRGVTIVDTDGIAHELTASGGAAIAPIRAEFGDTAIDASGAMDRKAMRDLVFADPEARRRLEAILHPMIRDESDRRCRAASSTYVILAVPLLIESGSYRKRCNRICVVDCPVATQIARVMTRNNLDEHQIRAIIAAQTSREDRLEAADDVIDNSGDLAALDDQVEILHASYLQAASSAA